MQRRDFLIAGGVTAATLAATSSKGLAMFGFGTKQTHGKGAFPYQLTDQQWKDRLSDQAYQVLRHHKTERAGSSPLDKNTQTGTYHCAGCDQKLFSSTHKFDSGTGWPSFYQPLDGVDSQFIGEQEDKTLWMERTEVHCTNCGGHQGHVFPDGPKPTGLRYCINGVALNFKPTEG